MFSLLLFTFVASVCSQSKLLPGSCDFESSTCGYTPDTHFRSWTLNKDGRFVTVDTVSEGEHQEAPEEGGVAAQRGEASARGVLLSPVLDQEDWSCLRLVYQITGAGGLEVLLRSEGKGFDRPLWSSQAPSDSWVISSMDLPNTTEPYRVAIDGSPGELQGSSVAIFEIHISPGYCLECNFEETHLCGYRNQWNTNVNWYIGGGLAVQSDLPNDDKIGHFMYVDSIYAKTFKEVAKLVSPMTTVPMSGCLGFQYQRGEKPGNRFSVYTRDQLGQYQEVWNAASENQTDWTADPSEWIPVQVDVKAPYPVQVVFEVAFNSQRGGRVKVDDITFSSEFCSADTEPTFDPSIANCDFESGLCHYTQDTNLGSAWKRVAVKPNLFRNGDHTTGAGSFLLSQSSVTPGSRPGARFSYVSRLVSPLLPGNMKYCLRVHYSLRGFSQTEQALVVYLQHQSSKKQEKVWTQGERSKGIWIANDITFQTTQPSKLLFVSICRSFWDCGSVALDDISLSLGDCELKAGLSLSVPGHCDFEAGLCGYTQDKRGDAGDWMWRRGSTPTSYTGPRGDHTTGLGYYMYMEASPMMPGQGVRLRSRALRGSHLPKCLRFFYHMYGSGVGELRVHLARDGEDTLVWKRAGEQSVAWLRAVVEYHSDYQHQIVFEATRGSSVRSDIAIDDIVFENGPCKEIEIHVANGSSNEIE
ncbi:unnamed protein product [Boreogadus saida]